MMRVRLKCLFVGLLWIGVAFSLQAETIRVATYNVRNYLNMDRWVEGHWRKDYPKPVSEKKAVREIIRRIAPDVLALQEMGGPGFLAELQADLKAEGLAYPFAAILNGPDDARRLAMLSRLKPVRVLSHDRIPFRYFGEAILTKRGLQEAVFETGGLRWSLFNVHLKSRWSRREDDPLSARQREGEAQAIRDFIRHRHPPDDQDSRYLVVGDFNDARDSPTLQRFLKVGDTMLTQLVECTDSRGEAWTFHYRRRDLYERVDFILVSPPMKRFIRGGAGTIVDILPEANIASDHRMVYVDLDFPER